MDEIELSVFLVYSVPLKMGEQPHLVATGIAPHNVALRSLLIGHVIQPMQVWSFVELKKTTDRTIQRMKEFTGNR